MAMRLAAIAHGALMASTAIELPFDSVELRRACSRSPSWGGPKVGPPAIASYRLPRCPLQAGSDSRRPCANRDVASLGDTT